MGTYYIALGTLLRPLWQPKWEENLSKSSCMYTYNCFTLLYSRNQHNIARQLCSYSVSKSCPSLCNPINCSMPGFLVLHCLQEFAQTHVH